MTKTSTLRQATRKRDDWDESLDADETAGTSWAKTYVGGIKHRHYSTLEDAN